MIIIKNSKYLLINRKSYIIFSKCKYKNSTYLYLINSTRPFDKLIIKIKDNKTKIITNKKLLIKLTDLLIENYKLKHDILT